MPGLIRAHPTKRDAPVPPSVNTAPNWISNSGFSYDSGGNMIADDTGRSYQWDAEGRLKSVDNGTTWSAVYNAFGHQVERSASTWRMEIVYDAFGQELGTYDGNGSAWWSRNVALGGRSIGIYFSNYVRFLHANHLGTTNFVTDGAGATLQDQRWYPWGQQWDYAGAQHDLHFASLEQPDSSTGLYPTQFRMYQPRFYRWLSPDPMGGDIMNPQSLNRYAYVMNNPVNFTDPLGLQGECWPSSNCDPHTMHTSPPPGTNFGCSNCFFTNADVYFRTLANAERRWEMQEHSRNVVNTWNASKGIYVDEKKEVWVYQPGSTITTNASGKEWSVSDESRWVRLSTLDAETQAVVTLQLAGMIAAPAADARFYAAWTVAAAGTGVAIVPGAWGAVGYAGTEAYVTVESAIPGSTGFAADFTAGVLPSPPPPTIGGAAGFFLNQFYSWIFGK